jgi:hypothetical protein
MVKGGKFGAARLFNPFKYPMIPGGNEVAAAATAATLGCNSASGPINAGASPVSFFVKKFQF